MKIIHYFQKRLTGLGKTVTNYPLTLLFLLAITIVNILSINNNMADYSNYLFTFIIGAVISAVGQQVYERFYTKINERLIIMGIALVLTLIYYFILSPITIFSVENGTKTAVMLLALALLFVWVPSIKSNTTFNESFMATFKAFFLTILFTLVIVGGLSAIIMTTDSLLFNVHDDVLPHLFNIVFALFAPLFFLSFIPPYVGKKDSERTTEELREHEAIVNKAIHCPNYLQILITYIIVPLTAIYTIILVTYVVLNISGEFWTKNLMEPLLVSYSITVIIVYILASTVENKITQLFRKFFPKILVPIVLFQTLASILKIQEMGVTYGRYYVILFGVFAVIVGVIFSILPIRKNGLIAAVFIAFSIISIVPPIDAFTVSRHNQTSLLEKTLMNNEMLENDTIIPNGAISIEDKKTITRTVYYLSDLEYADTIAWFPEDIYLNNAFKETFGFAEVYEEVDNDGHQYVYFDWESNPVIPTTDSDVMIQLNTYVDGYESDTIREIPFDIKDEGYTLKQQQLDGYFSIQIIDKSDEEIIEFTTNQVVEKIMSRNVQQEESGDDPLLIDDEIGIVVETMDHSMLTIEEATVIVENERAKLTILVTSASMYEGNFDSDFYLFIQMK